MEYNLRVLPDNDDIQHWKVYNAFFGNIPYADMKALVEKLTVSIEENIHPITIDITDNNNRYDTYRLYFTRKLAIKWLHKLTPCNKSGGEIKLRAVDWK